MRFRRRLDVIVARRQPPAAAPPTPISHPRSPARATTKKEHVPPFHSSFIRNPLSLPTLCPVDLRDSFSRL
jgi:hypothetical protein